MGKLGVVEVLACQPCITGYFHLCMKNVKPDIAYEYIRKRILDGDFPPGHALMTEQLSEAIGVSRTPVTEALLKLQSDGLVTIRPRLGANVKKMDMKEFREVCDMRLALEAHAAGLAALNRHPDDLREIEIVIIAMRALAERIIGSADDAPFLVDENREDVRFHIGVISAAKNELIKREILRLHLVNRIVAMTFMGSGEPSSAASRAERDANRRAVLASHEEIFQAIARQDAAAAKHAMERHIQDIIDKNVRLMTRTEGALSLRELTPEELVYTS